MLLQMALIPVFALAQKLSDVVCRVWKLNRNSSSLGAAYFPNSGFTMSGTRISIYAPSVRLRIVLR